MNTTARILNAPKPIRKAPNENIVLVFAKDYSRRTAYYFVKTTAATRVLLEKTIGSEAQFNISDFGEVITSGYGDPVPEHVQIWMREYHGWQG